MRGQLADAFFEGGDPLPLVGNHLRLLLDGLVLGEDKPDQVVAA
jgi:hypothetical protein